MIRNAAKIVCSIAFSLSLTACGLQQPEYLKMISATELNATMQTQDIFLVDVHTPKQQHIKGTDLFIPFNAVANYQAQLPKDKNTPIYLYCLGSPMGTTAAKALHDLGYTNLFNLDGGSNTWKMAGFQFE
ncbi:MAG: rhodanese-like domain-containing protein [Methyloprofundus sp.]|nr:rhodanese-like domain-containing protein [Methyloprofundus sp.]